MMPVLAVNQFKQQIPPGRSNCQEIRECLVRGGQVSLANRFICIKTQKLVGKFFVYQYKNKPAH